MCRDATFREVVVAKTVGALGSFLDEISRNTSKYKTVHNLTEQIEHQYAGRFAIELIQNAHDPIRPDPGWNGGTRRVELLLDGAGAHGTLLVANDGRPFRPEDFEALSNLGQSSKDPKEAIGNKGIGFRSVLEVARAPEVYSCRVGAPGAFEGFCFRFDPEVLDGFEAVIERVLSGDNDPTWQHEGAAHRVEGVRGAAIRARARDGLDVRREVRFLSAYSLPLPAEPSDPAVLEFARRGFATVVRLPLIDAAAREKVEGALRAICEDTILFLPQVESLIIRTAAGVRSFRRKEAGVAGAGVGRREVVIETDGAGRAPRRYWLWRRTYGEVPEGAPADHRGRAEAQRLADAVAKLPGNWKELREAEIAIAVERKLEPSPGSFFIHLPTQEKTGVGAHLHAPFYGDMSRKAIDFADEEVNQVLLGALADLAHCVVAEELIGRGPEEGAAALDITARQSDGETSKRWRSELDKRRTLGLALYHTDQGWRDAMDARIIAAKAGARILTRARLRAHAAFPALSEPLAGREALASAQIGELLGDAEPAPEERARTVEAAAAALQVEGGADWNAFLSEVSGWIASSEHVAKAMILPDEKGVLRAAQPEEGGPQLFLPPVRGEGASEVVDVPTSLASRVAFLSPSIVIRQPGQQLRPNALGSWLQKIVEDYRAEPILSRVLVPALPERATKLTSEEERLCRDVLGWAVQLVQRAEGEATLLPVLSKLRVPCRGGWFRMTEAIAGPGWTELGYLLDQALGPMQTAETKSVLDRMLLPIDDEAWSGAARFVFERRGALGVRDGLLPMEPIRSWQCRFTMMNGLPVALPESAPPGATAEQWASYAAFARRAFEPRYDGYNHWYELLGATVLPGFDVLDRQPSDVRRRYAEVVIRSIPRWPDGWQDAVCRKDRGSHHPEVRSFLAHILTEWPWIWVDDEQSGNGGNAHRPKDLWYVPQLRTHNRYHYAHLNPLPPDLCRAVDEAQAGPALVALELPRCAIDDDTDPVRTPNAALLNALSAALDEGRIDSGAQAIFIGQVRKAWKWFGIAAGTPLPVRLVVQQGGRLRTVATGEGEVFLPVGGASATLLGVDGELPVLCIEPKDAEDLAPLLAARHPGKILPLSSVQLEVQVDGRPWFPSEGAPRIEESELRWVAPLALAVSAFGGQGRGTAAKTFRQAAAALRRARVEAAPKLEVRLSRNGQLGPPVSRSAHLDPGAPAQGRAPTLLYDPAWPKGYAELARPLQALLDRNDLRSDLLVVLDRLQRHDGEPDRDASLRALQALDIDDARLQEVELALLGDLDAKIRRLRPVVQLVAGPTAAARLSRAQMTDELEKVLEGMHPALTTQALVEAARSHANDREMGLWLHQQIGPAAELDRWNTALETLGGEYRPISNLRALREDLEEHRRELRVPLRALARAVAGDGVEYERLRDEIDHVALDDGLGTTRWSLSFRATARMLLAPLASRLPGDLTAALQDSSEAPRFIAALEQSNLGVDPAIDPTVVHADNDRKCARILEELVRAAIVWCGRAQLSVGGWAAMGPLSDAVAAAVRTGRGFLDRFDDAQVLSVIRAALPRGTSLAADGPYTPFWQALDGARSVADLLAALGLAPEDLDGASEILRHQEEAARRKKRMERIAGAEFDTGVENLNALFEHISKGIPSPAPLDLAAVSALAPVGVRRRAATSRHGGTPPGGRGRRYVSQELKNAIALAGEIHAYRWLLSTYGNALVGPACWLSSLATHVFPSNQPNDGAGCDLRLTLPGSGILLHLEVKATPGSEEAFELGSSEIELARELATTKRRRKKEVFKILHVLEVFSPTPIPVLLPNPYDPKQQVVRLDEASVRMHYRRAHNASSAGGTE